MTTPTASGVPMEHERTKGREPRGFFREESGLFVHENGVDFVCSAVVNARSFDRVTAELDATVARLREVGKQRDALVAALEGMTPAMPQVNAHCHNGIVPQERCSNCQRIARAIAALASVRNGGKS